MGIVWLLVLVLSVFVGIITNVWIGAAFLIVGAVAATFLFIAIGSAIDSFSPRAKALREYRQKLARGEIPYSYEYPEDLREQT
jgi:hypothetical protein